MIHPKFDEVLTVDDRVIYALANFSGKRAYYYLASQNRRQIKRIGYAPPDAYYQAAREIFFKNNFDFNIADKKSIDKNRLAAAILKIDDDDLLRKRINLLDACGLRYLERGFILIKTRKNKEACNLMRIRDLDAAIRQQGHILRNYSGAGKNGGEIEKIENMIQILQASNHLLNERGKAREDIAAIIDEGIVALMKQLINCRDPYKDMAASVLADTSAYEDSLGRYNPGANAAKLIDVFNNLSRRLLRINNLVPFIAYRQAMLDFEHNYLKGDLKTAAINIRALIRREESSIKKYQKDAFRQLTKAKKHTERLWPAPYHYRAREALLLLAKAEKRFAAEDYRQMKNALAEAHFWLMDCRPENAGSF